MVIRKRRGRTCQGLDEVANAKSDAMLIFARIEWDLQDAWGEMSAAPPPCCLWAKFAINNDPIKTHNQTFLCSEKWAHMQCSMPGGLLLGAWDSPLFDQQHCGRVSRSPDRSRCLVICYYVSSPPGFCEEDAGMPSLGFIQVAMVTIFVPIHFAHCFCTI